MIRFAIYKLYISLEGYMCVMHDVSTEHIKIEEHPASTEHTYHDNYTLTKVQDSDNQ